MRAIMEMPEVKTCPQCGGEPLLCEPNYANEGGTMVVCRACDFAGDSFVLGMYGEGRDSAVAAWNALERTVLNIKDTPGYKAIVDFYGDRRARRSGVRLMDHVDQGVEIIGRLGGDIIVQEAFAVHPIFQADDDLRDNFQWCDDLHPLVVLYAMEYRNIANSFLSNQVKQGPDAWGRVGFYAKRSLRLSPLAAVNTMLIADKVQNRKDFLRYHKDSHDRSGELDFYFDRWLQALGISEEKYQELVEGL
jgi:hypothetical protein